MLHVLIKHRHVYFYAAYGTTSSCMLTPTIWSVVKTEKTIQLTPCYKLLIS
jgi:hypothetical protein